MANRKRPTQSSEVAIVEAIFGGLATLVKLLWNAVRGPKASSNPKAAQQLRDGWEQVELHLAIPATHAIAISEADKLFDLALKSTNLPGQTLGERLKAGEPRFEADQYHRLWNAHKLRNRLAHEVGASASKLETEAAVRALQAGIIRLGFKI